MVIKKVGKNKKSRATKAAKPTKAKAKVVATTQPAAQKPSVPVTPDEQVVAPKRVKWSAAEVKAFRNNLEKLRERTEDAIKFLATGKASGSQEDVSTERVSDEDQGADNFNYETAMHLASNAQGTLNEIAAAFHRLQMGVYGACEQCHTLIAKPRLEAQPFAKLCIKCKSAAEKDRPRFRTFEKPIIQLVETDE